MSDNPLVSIVIPVYKVEPYLDRCVGSVVSQTWRNIEIILVDDGSPDNCPQMCDEWRDKDNRVTVIHKKNGGLSDARNAGMAVMSGDYVLFVDSDDWIDEDTVETLLDCAETETADIVCCGMYSEYEQKTDIQRVREGTYFDMECVRQLLLDRIRPEACSKLYRCSTVGDLRFDKSVRYAEDVPFNYSVFKVSRKVTVINVPKYHYNLANSQSITAVGMNEHRAGLYRILNSIIEDCRDDKDLYEAAVFRYSVIAFSLLSMVLLNKSDTQKYYDEIADDILAHRSEILRNPLCSNRKKTLTRLLSVNKTLFRFFVRIVRG